MEERRRGELGYTAWTLHLTDMGICSCDGCGGHLVDECCLSCGCGHAIQDASRFHERMSVWIPTYEGGRCANADRLRAEAEREYERQARRRRTYEGPA